MVDQEIIKIANERIQIEIKEQNIILRSEIESAKRKMAARGVFQSSASTTSVLGICLNGIKSRAQLVWQTLFRFITTTGISYSDELANELKELVARHLPVKLGDFKGYVKQTAQMSGNPKLHERFEDQLSDERKRALAKVGTEIDLFVHSLKKKATATEDEISSTVFNIYSPVGSIQTGGNSVANVSQTIDVEVKERIIKVLEDIGSALNQSDIEASSSKDELIEIIQESQAEITKTKPNFIRLRSLLTTVGTSIQVVSSLKPAYETFKQLLTFLGISLP